MADEFDLIHKYFAPLAGENGLGLRDDAACLPSVPGMDYVVTKDLLIESVHFRPDDPVASIAYKALAVNISDCIAKGAKPDSYFVGLALPRGTSPDWFATFADGLFDAQTHFGCKLTGGDTTTHDQSLVVISITMLGLVVAGKMIKRSTAAVGDDLYVTGTLGDSAFGLWCLQNDTPDHHSLKHAYQKPSPSMAALPFLQELATSAADVSDGLIADVGHIAIASEVGFKIYADKLPISEVGRAFVATNPSHQHKVWSGGDDYQVVFTAHAKNRDAVNRLARLNNVKVTRIGKATDQISVNLLDIEGRQIQIGSKGYKHF